MAPWPPPLNPHRGGFRGGGQGAMALPNRMKDLFFLVF